MVKISAIRAGAVAAAATLSTPAWAVSVDVFASIGVGFPGIFLEVTNTDTDEVVDPDTALSVEPGPGIGPDFDGFLGVGTTASLDGPGSQTSVAEAVVTVGNLLEQEISVLFDYDATHSVELQVDAPGDRAFGAIDSGVFFQGESIGGNVESFSLDGADCSFPPCNDLFEDAAFTTIAITLAPMATEELLLRTEATAIAAIPLPAALGPAVLALGGLAWIGRRRA